MYLPSGVKYESRASSAGDSCMAGDQFAQVRSDGRLAGSCAGWAIGVVWMRVKFVGFSTC